MTHSDDQPPPLPGEDSELGQISPTGPTEIPDLKSLLEQMHQAGTESFQRSMAQAGGPVSWLSSTCPTVASAKLFSSEGMAERIPLFVPRETEAFWTGIEQRLTECAHCLPTGAACDGSRGRISPGRLVELRLSRGDTPTAAESPCSRYRDHRLAKKLESVGVAERFSRVKLAALPEAEEIQAVFTRVVMTVCSASSRGTGLYIEGKLARAYGSALLRNIVLQCPGLELRSAHIGSVMRESRDAMQTKAPSPLLPLIEPQVLVLDSAESELGYKGSSGRLGYEGREMRFVYERRRDQKKTTIVTSTVDVREVFPGIDVLRV